MQSSADDDHGSRLFPGDRLIEIEGVSVENLTREDIVSKIRSAGSQVTLLVQSMHDLNHSSSSKNKYNAFVEF